MGKERHLVLLRVTHVLLLLVLLRADNLNPLHGKVVLLVLETELGHSGIFVSGPTL